MPLHALPILQSLQRSSSSSRKTFSLPRHRKRKRSPPLSSSSSAENEDDDAPSLPPASTNPLSLAPNEILQYKAANLELDQRLPNITDFPHRRLPADYGVEGLKSKGRDKGKGKEKESDTEREIKRDIGEVGKEEEKSEELKKNRGLALRTQHLQVLTAILQKCLAEGDIKRATRAWALLIRTHVGGHSIDLRGSGYWGIGAELLIRNQDAPAMQKDDEEQSDEEEDEKEEAQKPRWGTAEGLEKAKDYYQKLILEFPYKRQYHRYVSALDFWPAMVACEVYGVQWEWKEGLRRVSVAEERDGEEEGLRRVSVAEERDGEEEGSSGASSQEDNLPQPEDDGYDSDTIEAMKITRRRNRKAEKRWLQKDEIRRTALIAAEKIAGKLDSLMITPPYSDSHVLLRLRGMLALWVGDLSVSALSLDDSEDDEEVGRRDGEAVQRRLLKREREAERRRGKMKQVEERERAGRLFDKIRREGGRVDEDLGDQGMADEDEMGEEQDGGHDELYDA